MDPEVSAGVVHSLIPYESHESDRFGRSGIRTGPRLGDQGAVEQLPGPG